MPMRVIAGEYRHRKLVYPEDNINIRPTKDRIREAFFSIIGDINNKSFLDLYAGCGSIGIEAISRGAKNCIFVDSSREALRYVNKNIENLGIQNSCKTYLMNDFTALENFKNQNLLFDVIYLDPPYQLGQYEDILEFIFSNHILDKNGMIGVEINRELKINPLWNKKIKEYHYGEINLYLFYGEVL